MSNTPHQGRMDISGVRSCPIDRWRKLLTMESDGRLADNELFALCHSMNDFLHLSIVHILTPGMPIWLRWGVLDNTQTQHCSHNTTHWPVACLSFTDCGVFMVYVINYGCSVGQLVVCCPPTNAARFDSWLRSVPGAVSRKSLSSAVWVTLCPWVGTLTQYGGTLKELTVLLKKSRGISQVLAARYWMH